MTMDFEKLYAARLHATRVRPYLATALFALQPVESSRVPTMAVDKHWRCYVSPAFVAARSIPVLAAVLVHEVSHLLRDHHGRSARYAAQHGRTGPGESLRMNIAADFEINDDVYDESLRRPPDAAHPGLLNMPAGRLMEEYLDQFSLCPLHGLAWLDCGSGADGAGREWDLGPDGAHGLTARERDAVRFRVAQGINGQPGDVPDGWRRWAEEAFHPPQPWRELLGAAVRAAAAGSGSGDDYTYGRPARRSAALPGVVLPALRRRPPRVAVIIDTSGSVSDAELGTALLEVTAIGRAAGGGSGQVSVLSCDAAADVAGPICRTWGIPLVGGGGTDMRAGFARVLSESPRPDVVVVLTDGQTPWPSRPPCRTVVGLFPRRGEWVERPSWARVVTVGSGR
ncbi:vWA domain-containing protein [Paractinoplanes rishiriensis]|uniref:Metal-dependent peptidase n=1 Tax=Paractinoplanes rishiriensis TaxID=1050105 RepID=A0A919MS51_9ACTN|nr:VWA-like domain-containing protein [Actinoplanes rishiriensis]GIE93278.1 hypothetical protein Ari01nite_07430 [Actinoplanes rishiriensis]